MKEGWTIGALEQLLLAQSAHFAALDPLLPAETEPPDGEVVIGRCPNGVQVAGVLTHSRLGQGELLSLSSAREVYELHPLVGAAGGAGMEPLLARWQSMVRSSATSPADSSCLVTWPSRDVLATRALLDHGFQPLSVLAVRTAPSPPVYPPDGGHQRDFRDEGHHQTEKRDEGHHQVLPGGGLTVRRATTADLAAVLRLVMIEYEYSLLVGTAARRPDAELMKHRAIEYHLSTGAPAWLAVLNGRPVGLAECRLINSSSETGKRYPVPPGLWGYLNCVSVLPEVRGSGIGRQLMATAHHGLHEAGAIGTYLTYNPPNPLSSVFWPRQGYRPLWTIWEIRPASALR